jgi:hypothetical protein
MAKKNKHSWNYENIGGSTRVKITSGADIAHLDQLDPKMWTVLSCPSIGLEIEDKSLQYIDTDSDGRIRVNDIVATAKWMTSAIKNADLLLTGDDSFDIEQFNQEDATGKKLYNSSQQILANINKEDLLLICLIIFLSADGGISNNDIIILLSLILAYHA